MEDRQLSLRMVALAVVMQHQAEGVQPCPAWISRAFSPLITSPRPLSYLWEGLRGVPPTLLQTRLWEPDMAMRWGLAATWRPSDRQGQCAQWGETPHLPWPHWRGRVQQLSQGQTKLTSRLRVKQD